MIVRGRTGRGLAPLFVWIGLTVGTWLLGIIVGVVLAASLFTGGYV